MSIPFFAVLPFFVGVPRNFDENVKNIVLTIFVFSRDEKR